MKTHTCLRTAAISGFLAVALGAFGAHLLKNKLSAADLQIFETGVRYQMYHSLALFGTGILMCVGRGSKAARVASWSFLVGMIIFSGTLYALTLTGQRWLGMITPIGGLALMFGWLSLAFAARESKPEQAHHSPLDHAHP